MAEKFSKQFTCLRENTEKYINVTVPIEKEVTRININGEKLQKIYPSYYNLLIAQDLWQAHYQILSIDFLKEFVELNVNLDMTMKKYETCKIKYKYCNCFLEYQNFKDDLMEYKCLCCEKRYQHKFDKKLKQ